MLINKMDKYQEVKFLILRRKLEVTLYHYFMDNACNNSIVRLQEYLNVISHNPEFIIHIIDQLYLLLNNHNTSTINNTIIMIVNNIQHDEELIQNILSFISI